MVFLLQKIPSYAIRLILNYGSLAYQQYLLAKTIAKIGENGIYWKSPELFDLTPSLPPLQCA
jgi:hypothetical protein